MRNYIDSSVKFGLIIFLVAAYNILYGKKTIDKYDNPTNFKNFLLKFFILIFIFIYLKFKTFLIEYKPGFLFINHFAAIKAPSE